MSLIESGSVPRLAAAWPHAPAVLRHRLAHQPLFAPSALADLVRALPAGMVEHRVSAATSDQPLRLLPASSEVAAAIGDGSAAGLVTLRGLEHLPTYRRLICRLLRALGPVIGEPQEWRGLLYLSAPGTHTPFHFDAEYSVLFQVAGSKVLATYDPEPPFLELEQREACQRSGDNLLDWKPAFADVGKLHHLAPGDALFVPYCAPHWVHVGEERSVSLGISWQDRRSRDLADALRLNPLLRRLGIPPVDTLRTVPVPRLHALAGRFGQRIGLL